MLHNKRRKSKGENWVDFKDLHARNDARQDYRINMIHITEMHLVNSVHPVMVSVKLSESTKKSGKACNSLPFKWAIK